MDDEPLPGQPLPVQDLLGPGAPAAGAADLRRIVARADRRRRRMSAGALALTLLLGGLGGYLVSGRPASRPVATTPLTDSGAAGPLSQAPPTASPPSPTSGSSAAPAMAALAPVRRLFTRTANGVTIRGFLMSYPGPPLGKAPAPAGCSPVARAAGAFTAEVSTDRMVGTVGLAEQSALSGPVGPVGVQVTGQREGDQRLVVMVQVAAQVSEVSVSFASGGSDHMSPVDGWVAVSSPMLRGQTPLSSPLGALTATGAGGQVLVTEPVVLGPLGVPPAIASPGCVHGFGAGSASSGPPTGSTG